MSKIIPLSQSGKNYLHRKHNLTIEEIRESPAFSTQTDGELEEVRATFEKMAEIMLDFIEYQQIVLERFERSDYVAVDQQNQKNAA